VKRGSRRLSTHTRSLAIKLRYHRCASTHQKVGERLAAHRRGEVAAKDLSAVERDMVEAGAKLAAGIGPGARVVGKPEAAAAAPIDVALARRAEALRLHGGVRRDPDNRHAEATATQQVVS
jgi:hypothetical protein